MALVRCESDRCGTYSKIGTITRAVYVDGGRLDSYTEDGSRLRPFKTIQAAYDYAKTKTPTYLSPVTLAVSPGDYPDSVIVDGDYIHIIGIGGQFVTNICTGAGSAFIVTNATRESLTTFFANGGLADPNAHYGDLAVGSGLPQTVEIRDVSIGNPSGGDKYDVLIMGVGDGTSFCGNELNFTGSLVAKKVFARLANFICFQDGCWVARKIVVRNVAGVWCNDSQISGYEGYYDAADDEPSDTGNYGLCGGKVLCVGDVVLNAGAGAGAADPTGSLCLFQVTGNLDLNGTSMLTMVASGIGGDIDAEAGASFGVYGCHVQGDITIAAGAGTARMDGGKYMGTLTDAGVKLVRNIGN